MPRIMPGKSHRRITLFTVRLTRGGSAPAAPSLPHSRPKTHIRQRGIAGCNQYSHGDASMQFRTCSRENRWIARIAPKEFDWLHEPFARFLSLAPSFCLFEKLFPSLATFCFLHLFHLSFLLFFFVIILFSSLVLALRLPLREREGLFTAETIFNLDKSLYIPLAAAFARVHSRIGLQRTQFATATESSRRVSALNTRRRAAVTSQSELQTKRVPASRPNIRNVYFPEAVSHSAVYGVGC